MYCCDECCEKCKGDICTAVNKPFIDVTKEECPQDLTKKNDYKGLF